MVGDDDGEAAEDGERSHAALDNVLEMEVITQSWVQAWENERPLRLCEYEVKN